MDAVQKFRNQLDPKRRAVVDAVIRKLVRHDLSGLDIKKLKGEKNCFRVRKGKIRIIYKVEIDGKIVIDKASLRDDTTYN